MAKSLDICYSVWILYYSLSGYEKATISGLLARTSEGKISQFIFNLMEEMTQYDREYANERFKQRTDDNNFARSLAALKAYIYRNLPGIYQEPGGKLSKIIQQIHMALARGDYDYARAFVVEAKQLGWEQECFGKLEEVLMLERRILKADDQMRGRQKKLAQNSKEWARVGEIYQNYKAYEFLEEEYYNKYAAMLRETGDKAKKQIATLVEHLLLQSEEQALSARAKLIFCKLREMGHWAAGNTKAANSYSAKSLQLFESHAWLTDEYSSDYWRTLRRNILMKFEMGDFKNGLTQLTMFEEIKTLSKSESVKVLGNLLFVKLIYCLHTNDDKVLAEVKSELNNNLEDILHFFEPEYSHAMLFQAIVIAWRKRDFSSAYKWIEGIFRLEKTEVQKSKQVFARLYHMIFLFEEKDFKSISAAALRHIRYLRKIKWPHRLELLVFRFFKSINELNDQQEIAAKMEGLKKNLGEQVSLTELQRYKDNTGLMKWFIDKIEIKSVIH